VTVRVEIFWPLAKAGEKKLSKKKKDSSGHLFKKENKFGLIWAAKCPVKKSFEANFMSACSEGSFLKGVCPGANFTPTLQFAPRYAQDTNLLTRRQQS
jgi:hypothetical protein